MNIIKAATYAELSAHAAKIVIDQLTRKPTSLICAASGNSPVGLYQQLAQMHADKPHQFSQMRVIKLDEWLGPAMDDPSTCEYFLRQELLDPLEISASRYFAFDSNPVDAEAECTRIRETLNNTGPIDLCILGLGTNGHLALIEPGEKLIPYCHVSTLAQATREHSMLKHHNRMIRHGLTLGLAEILSSQAIILLVTGAQKNTVAQQLLKPIIATSCPASFLWLHPKVDVVIDESIFSV